MLTKRNDQIDAAPDLPRRTSPIIEAVPLPMIGLEGPQHVVCFANSAFCRLVQKRPDEILGKPFVEIVHNGEDCGPLLDRLGHGGEIKTTGTLLEAPAPSPTQWLYATWPALDSSHTSTKVIIQLTTSAQFLENVSAMNEALLIGALRQHELRDTAEKSNARLEIEIVERRLAEAALRDANVELKAAQNKAESANRAKDDFIATLSHELRTPLTPVLITAAALREDERLPIDAREQLAMMEHNIALEGRLIDDLLDLTRISHGKLQLRLQSCDMEALIDFAIEIVREEARAKGVSFQRSSAARPSELMGDPTRLQQVIWNLLRNAVKFTPSGGVVSINTRRRVNPEGVTWLRIEVADTGVGIEPQQLEKIFLPFVQAGRTEASRSNGLGLGLSIARAVVDLHGGRIGAHSAGRDRGATFVVELPGTITSRKVSVDTMIPLSSHPPADVLSGPKTGPLCLLVVEDHPSTLQALVSLLRRDGHTVVPTTTVAEAQSAADLQRFDFVISDLGLPDGTGIELMHTLRKTYGLSGIALSGYGMGEDLSRSREAGFITHLVKPVAITELRRVIATLKPTPKNTGPASAAVADHCGSERNRQGS